MNTKIHTISAKLTEDERDKLLEISKEAPSNKTGRPSITDGIRHLIHTYKAQNSSILNDLEELRLAIDKMKSSQLAYDKATLAKLEKTYDKALSQYKAKELESVQDNVDSILSRIKSM